MTDQELAGVLVGFRGCVQRRATQLDKIVL